MTRFDALNGHYGTPCKRGLRIEFDGRPATIAATNGSHLSLRFDGEKRTTGYRYHPLYAIDYLDGTDYAARHDARVARFVSALKSPSRETP